MASPHVLAEFLATVSVAPDVRAAVVVAVERIAAALNADVCAVVRAGVVEAEGGPVAGQVDSDELVAAGTGGQTPFPTAAALVEDQRTVVVIRYGQPLDPEERRLLEGMAESLGLTLRLLDALRTAREREELLGRLTLLQRSISLHAPLQEVLDALTTGAATLLGDELVGLRLVDPDDPAWLGLAAHQGIKPEMVAALLRSPVNDGVGGRAIAENRLVVEEDYPHAAGTLPVFVQDALQAAMAAPVHSDGRPIGSLVTASYMPGRRYSPSEQEALLAFAEHASLALSDARTVEAMREARCAREVFLATMSHELKTPLTVVMGTLRTLEQHRERLDPAQQDELLRTAFARGRDLEHLIDQLLAAPTPG